MKELLDLLADVKSPEGGGNCFVVTVAMVSSPMFEALCRSQRNPVVLSEKSPFRVVHGLPVGSPGSKFAGKRHWHAWVELAGRMRSQGVDLGPGTVVLDYSNGHKFQVPRPDYYRIGRLNEEHVYRYTPGEARKLAKKQNSCGPWVPNYEAMEEV